MGIEGCSSTHYWSRKLQALGHTVRLMTPHFVKQWVKSNKNDVADADASCEAAVGAGADFSALRHELVAP